MKVCHFRFVLVVCFFVLFCFSCMFVMFCSVWGSRWCLRPHTQQFLLLLSFDLLTEIHFTAKSLRMLFQDISPEKIFYFLKEINIFGKI